MKTNQLRIDCDSLFPNDSRLRKLASDIASLRSSEAQRHGLVSATPAPYNLLANGETEGWAPPTQVSPNDLIGWKKAANGFWGSTERGLSLLFDPFVDACLLIEAGKKGGPFRQKTKVLILTDYYPLSQIGVKAGQDWAAEETGKFFNALDLGLSGNNIFKALAKESLIENVRNTSEDEIRGLFSKKNLLIWNYFPFFRGGNNCQGKKGLPIPIADCRWIHYCEGLLRRFIGCVNASHVVFAMNQGVRAARMKCIDPLASPKYASAELNHPGSCRGIKKLEAWGSRLREVLEYNLCQE